MDVWERVAQKLEESRHELHQALVTRPLSSETKVDMRQYIKDTSQALDIIIKAHDAVVRIGRRARISGLVATVDAQH